jgi:hypothetical protein
MPSPSDRVVRDRLAAELVRLTTTYRDRNTKRDGRRILCSFYTFQSGIRQAVVHAALRSFLFSLKRKPSSDDRKQAVGILRGLVPETARFSAGFRDGLSGRSEEAIKRLCLSFAEKCLNSYFS